MIARMDASIGRSGGRFEGYLKLPHDNVDASLRVRDVRKVYIQQEIVSTLLVPSTGAFYHFSLGKG
jgi:hypothetical protein